MSQLETLLAGHDLTSSKDCMGWEKELKMMLPVGIWKSILTKDSLNVFYKRIVNYGPMFMSNLKVFAEYRNKPKVSFVEKALSVRTRSCTTPSNFSILAVCAVCLYTCASSISTTTL